MQQYSKKRYFTHRSLTPTTIASLDAPHVSSVMSDVQTSSSRYQQEMGCKGCDNSVTSTSSSDAFSYQKTSELKKSLCGLYLVMADFAATNECNISVHVGEQVTVWNQDNQHWFWIMRQTAENEEGFVPSCCLHEIATIGTSKWTTITYRYI